MDFWGDYSDQESQNLTRTIKKTTLLVSIMASVMQRRQGRYSNTPFGESLLELNLMAHSGVKFPREPTNRSNHDLC